MFNPKQLIKIFVIGYFALIQSCVLAPQEEFEEVSVALVVVDSSRDQSKQKQVYIRIEQDEANATIYSSRQFPATKTPKLEDITVKLPTGRSQVWISHKSCLCSSSESPSIDDGNFSIDLEKWNGSSLIKRYILNIVLRDEEELVTLSLEPVYWDTSDTKMIAEK